MSKKKRRGDARPTTPFRKVPIRRWIDTRFAGLTSDAKVLWFYLTTGPDATSLPGLIVAGEAHLAECLGWVPGRLREAFQELSGAGLAEGDWTARVVLLEEGAIADATPESPNVVRSWRSHFEMVPDSPLKWLGLQRIGARIARLGEGFREAFRKAFAEVLLARGGEMEMEMEIEMEREICVAAPPPTHAPSPPPDPRPARDPDRPDPELDALAAGVAELLAQHPALAAVPPSVARGVAKACRREGADAATALPRVAEALRDVVRDAEAAAAGGAAPTRAQLCRDVARYATTAVRRGPASAVALASSAAVPAVEVPAQLVEAAWVAFRKAYGQPYVAGSADAPAMRELVAKGLDVARAERLGGLGAEPGSEAHHGAALELLEHWTRAYLRDEGRQGYLDRTGHRVQDLAGGLTRYGVPKRWRSAGLEVLSAPRAAVAKAPSSEAEAETREALRELRARLAVTSPTTRPVALTA